MKTIAEFSSTYKNSLREYPKNRTPADYVKPKATFEARSVAKTSANFGDSPVKNPYMRSQTYWMPNDKARVANQQLLIAQKAHD